MDPLILVDSLGFLKIFLQYQEINRVDLLRTREELRKHDDLIGKLTDYRNQYLAHDDTQKEEITITQEEVKILFKLIKDILDLFSLRLDFSSTVYDLIENGSKNDTGRVIEYLQRFEPYRLKEIDEKYSN